MSRYISIVWRKIIPKKFFKKLVIIVLDVLDQARVSELWFVEELDLLALALNGRMKVRGFDLGGCSGRSGQPHHR